MKLLGTNFVGKTRNEYLEIRGHKKQCRQDYDERSVAEFATKIQSHIFGGNNYLPIEGVAL